MTSRWLTGRAFLFHLTLLVVVPGCLIACWWQITRAASGNVLSYAYAVEWPIFAVIATVAWWNLVQHPARAVIGGTETGEEVPKVPTLGNRPSPAVDRGAAFKAASAEAYRIYNANLIDSRDTAFD